MDPADADAVVAALQARGGRLAEAASVPEAEREEALASFEKDYGAASRAHVLDVRAHVLGRVAGALDAQPDLDLVDAVEAGSAGKYEHAYERADVEGGPVATAGGFLLNLRAHVMRGADGLLHQNPAMDVEDVLAVKARTKQAKLAARGVGVRRRGPAREQRFVFLCVAAGRRPAPFLVRSVSGRQPQPNRVSPSPSPEPLPPLV